MADLSSFTGKFRAQKSSANGSTPTKVTKRPKLACAQCQRSKLRCDRGQPCSSCFKKDEGAACSYEHARRPKKNADRNPAAEDRLLHLESMVKQLIENQASTQISNSTMVEESISSLGQLHKHPDILPNVIGKTIVEAKYVGSTHWSAILDDIQELKITLGGSEITEDESEFHPPEPFSGNGEVIFGLQSDYSLSEIISRYLPSKIQVDRLLSIYFKGETYIVPFIHISYFQQQYREFWGNVSGTNPLWLSMLFSICYMATLVERYMSSFNSAPNDSVEVSSPFHTAAGECLVLGDYQRPQKLAVEALAMYANCKMLRSLDPSREAGALLGMVVRMGYRMGYHRDPDSFGSFTAFEGEMRRRFWASCKQMDVMISFQLGLPSSIYTENCDTKSPRNLLDSEFGPEIEVLPPSRPETELTKILWFIVKERLMVSFGKVCRVALSFKEMTEAEILELDQQVHEVRSTIPPILQSRQISESIADPSFLIMTRIYLEFIYLKSLCVLHRKYMTRGNLFSTKACVKAGMGLVSQFLDMHKEFSPGGQLYTGRWMLSSFTMNDFLLGAMVLCLVVHTRWKRGVESSGIDAATEREVLVLLEQSLIICVEKSIASKDAKRVSHAVRMTLNRSKYDLANAAAREQSNDFTRPLLPPWSSHVQSGDEIFGQLDAFNFIGSDLEGMDWSVFDPQI